MAYLSVVLFGDDERNTELVLRMVVLKIVVLTFGAILRTVRHGIATRYHAVRILPACEWRGTLVPLNKHIWTLVRKYGIVHVLSFFDMHPIGGLLALT